MVREPHNSHFSVVQVTQTSPNYRFNTLHFEQRSALKCCISEGERERCQFSTDVKQHCFIGPNCSPAILQLLQRKHADSCTPVRVYSLHAHSHSSQLRKSACEPTCALRHPYFHWLLQTLKPAQEGQTSGCTLASPKSASFVEVLQKERLCKASHAH